MSRYFALIKIGEHLYLVFVSIPDIIHDSGQHHLLGLSDWLAYQVGVEPAMIKDISSHWLDQNLLTSCITRGH